MKMLKKLISMLSSMALIATMASVVVSADGTDYAAIAPVLTKVSDGVYDLSINLDVTHCAKGTKVQTMKIALPLEASIFDLDTVTDYTLVEDPTTGDEMKQYSNITGSYTFGNVVYFNLNVDKPVDNSIKKLIYVYSGANINGQNVKNANTSVVTFKNLKIRDGVTTEDIKIELMDVEVACGSSSTNYTKYTLENKNLNIGDPVTFPGNKKSVVVPTNNSDSVNESTILNVKPSDVGGTGDVWASADGSENAVAGLANFTPAAETTPTSIEWTIKATSVGGVTKEYAETFDLGAAIDAAATIGLIVNYNTAEYSSVSIVSGALK